MSGIAWPGEASINLCLDVQTGYIGNASGSWIPWNQWDEGDGGQPGLHDPFPFLAAGGPLVPAGGGGGVKPPPTARAGEAELDYTSIAEDWFDRVHILPRTKIAFGNIITLIEEDYEIFSAFRDELVILNAITNNATPGVDLPTVVPPVLLPSLSSILDPTSTDNSAGAGLGVLVMTKVQALQNGLPSFDTNIDFVFLPPSNSVSLFVSGTRVVFIPMHFGAPAEEVLGFLTDIIESLDGREQRIALRKNPRQKFEVTYALDGNDRQRMQAILFDWMDKTFGLPLWHENVRLTASVPPGTTIYPVSGADDCDFRVGGMAVVFQDNETFDVISIIAKTDNTITASDPSVNGYSAGAYLMPLRIAVIRRVVEGNKSLVNLETFFVEYEVIDNDTGAPAGTTVPGFWTIYNTRVLFKQCNFVDGQTVPVSHSKRVYLIDNMTGRISLSSTWDRGKKAHQKGFSLHSRAEILQFRKLLSGLRGSQKAFYIPSFSDDLTPNTPLLMGAATMDIAAIDYVRFVRNRFPMTIFEIHFTDGSSLLRTIINSATISSSTERLTLDDTWPVGRAVSEVERIEFYDLVRFDTDEFKMSYLRIGNATCVAPVIRVFDDN